MKPRTERTEGGRFLIIAWTIAMLAYPRGFRRRFGAEMRADFDRQPGWRPIPRLLVNGLAERWTAALRWSYAGADTHHLYEPSGRHARLWDVLRSDIRHTIRTSVRAPLHTSLAVLSLGLGIGANTAIFTVVYDVLLRPLPYKSANELLMVWSHDTVHGVPHNVISPADFADLQRDGRSVVALEGCFSFVTNNRLTIDGQSETAATMSVTPGLFSLLGREAAIGHALVPDAADDRIVLSNGFWHRRFGADPRVIGRRVDVGGQPFTIGGVMPDDFVFPYKGMLGPTGFVRSLDVDFWMPLRLTDPQLMNQTGQLTRSVHFLSAIGRLQPGVSASEARTTLAAIARRLEQAYPETNKGWTTTVLPLHEQVVGGVRPALLLLLTGVALVLLMACVNVANLVLARSVARRKELAVRAALGAGPWRLAAQALTETVLLAVAGALVALLFLSWAIRALVALAPDNLPRLQEVHPDAIVLVVSIAVAIGVGILIGTVPAIAAGRTDLRAALQDAGRGAIGSRHRLREALVVVEIALALILAIGAGLLLRSFVKLLDVDPGFRVDHLLTLQMNVPDRLTTPDARRAFYQEFFERIEAIPGVTAAGGTTRIPLGSTNVSSSIDVEGRAVSPGDRPDVEFRRALHNYFATMGIPVLRGRGFSAADGPTAPSVALINEAMARKVFPHEDPVGRRVRMGPASRAPWTTIVGVIGDVRHSRLDAEPAPEIYVSGEQNPPVAPFIVVRTTGDPADVAGQIRAQARTLDPTLTLYDIRTMGQIRSASIAEQRFLLLLIGLFGILALVLASLGVYGVMSLTVSERTQEVGVRLALGAEPSAVLAMIVGTALKLAVWGAVAGLVAGAALSPLMASQVFGVRPVDPVTFAVSSIVVVAAAALAALVPARRATKVDPMRALNAQ